MTSDNDNLMLREGGKYFDFSALLSLSCVSHDCDMLGAGHQNVSMADEISGGHRRVCGVYEITLCCNTVTIHASHLEHDLLWQDDEAPCEWETIRGTAWAYNIGDGMLGEPIEAPIYKIEHVKIGTTDDEA